VIRKGKILLIRKKTGLGAGKINGPGGRIEPGEDEETAAVRETREELGITPSGIKKAGELFFQFADGYALAAHVFTAGDFTGEPEETREAAPLWTDIDSIPFDQMWADDRLWFPFLLSGRKFRGFFIFDGDAMLDSKIDEIYTLSVHPRRAAMEERGIVVAKEAGLAKVRIERSEACEGCHGCLMSDTEKYMIADVIDRIGASPGDTVLIRTEGATSLRATLLLFGLPLVLVFAGYAVGSALAGVFNSASASQGFGIGGAAVFFLGSFGLVALINKGLSGGKAGRSAIVEILGRQEQTV
jgi:8-oxo-dGTP diphosphatase